MIRGRLVNHGLALCAGLVFSAGASAAEVSNEELLFCAAVFQFRAERLVQWNGEPVAALLWANRMAEEWSNRNPETRDGGCHSGGLVNLGYCRSVSPGYPYPQIDQQRARIRMVYESAARQAVFPATCMEDDACVVCLEALKSLD